MNPKEKAEYLIDKHLGFKLNPYNDPEMRSVLYRGKRAAIVTVDEILSMLIGSPSFINYWENVKNEIEKL